MNFDLNQINLIAIKFCPEFNFPRVNFDLIAARNEVGQPNVYEHYSLYPFCTDDRQYTDLQAKRSAKASQDGAKGAACP